MFHEIGCYIYLTSHHFILFSLTVVGCVWFLVHMWVGVTPSLLGAGCVPCRQSHQAGLLVLGLPA